MTPHRRSDLVVFMIIALLAGTIRIASAGAGDSVDDLPPDTPGDIKDAIAKLNTRKLFSLRVDKERGRAAKWLGDQGERAFPAIPYLIACLSDDTVFFEGSVKSAPEDRIYGATFLDWLLLDAVRKARKSSQDGATGAARRSSLDS